MIIDFHNHYYPPEYIEALQTGLSNIKVSIDSANNPVLHSPGDKNIAVPGHRDIDYRVNVLDEVGVDKQVLTFTAPGTLTEDPDTSAGLSRRVNDALAKIASERSDRFTALATLPLNNPAASIAEFQRATNELGFKGVMLFSNAAGVALADQRFWPIYEQASEVSAVMYIHPTFPVGVEAMTEYWLMPLVGFVFDTTLAAAHLVFSGVVERFPGVRWVLAHLGGTIPYLAERLDRGYEAFSECRSKISRPPSQYLKDFYYDTVNFDARALHLAIEFAGADRLLAGSDYPHQIGSLEKMVSSIGALGLSDEDRARILGGNTADLLGL
ncbi:MAG: amidohydrolase [Gemmatimonadota bacterium]|nr:MAG: amidohydrolase [Gemmatimonadota bacterium]